jgi:nucleoside-triphosphatase THEP1
MGLALLITGAPGTGKTTLIRAVVAALPWKAGGFFTEEIREADERIGFRVCSLVWGTLLPSLTYSVHTGPREQSRMRAKVPGTFCRVTD